MVKNVVIDTKLAKQFLNARKQRYYAYKTTQNENLFQITKSEYLYLDALASQIEGFTGVDFYNTMVDDYSDCVKKYIHEQPFVVNQRFNALLNGLLTRNAKASVNIITFSSNEELEDLLGEEACYDGETALLCNTYRLDLKEKLIKYLGKRAYYYIDQMLNNGSSLATLGEQEGVAGETIRQRCKAALLNKKSIARNKNLTPELLDILDALQAEETSTLECC